MSFLTLIFSAICLLFYFLLKYTAFYDFFHVRPSLKDVWAYKFENNNIRKRNARAFKIVAVLLAFCGLILLPFDRQIADAGGNRELAMLTTKLLLLFFIALNFMGRYVLYQELVKSQVKAKAPLKIMLDVYLKTNWFVRGKDATTVAINISSVMILCILLYILFKPI